jgi:hypothetical protein
MNMEMSWMETCQLLGLDLLAVMLVVLAGLGLLDHALHAVWATARSQLRRRPQRPSEAMQVATVSGE